MSGSPGLQRFRFAVGEALKRGDVAGAMNFADQAVGQGIEDIDLLTLAGQWRLRAGQVARALTVFERARALGPDNPEALTGLGISLTMLGRPQEALAAFDHGLAVAPGARYLVPHRAQALENAGRLREAQAALEQLVAAAPDNARALEQLASLCVRRGDMAAARDYATRALKIASPLPAATIAVAAAELSDGNYEAVRALVALLGAEPGIGPANQSIALGLLGDALDGLDKPDEAFAAYTAAREALRGPMAAMFQGTESALDRVRRLESYFREAPIAPWHADPSAAVASPVKTHVFLVGFPRSGTTLLEQALASHPSIRTMEEVDCLGAAAGEYFRAEDGMARFAALGDDDLARLRAAYWRRVGEAGIAADRPVFIDKMPLNSVHLGVIARLFPGAKVLFALRDPRDVVLSCFRRRLVMTAHLYELSTLAGAAAFYDAVMALARLYREKLALPVLDLKHEDMIADFDGETRRVCDFLGVEWSKKMRDFAADAKQRDIKTPSAMQVVRGLNADGAGQWRRFAAQLAPVLPVLAPWVVRFGYPE
ncbi:MAG: sulfotransferase [Rhizomicrobium sp.]